CARDGNGYDAFAYW
nr:immunoglobulin heavy chain junction region [Mus musculus]